MTGDFAIRIAWAQPLHAVKLTAGDAAKPQDDDMRWVC